MNGTIASYLYSNPSKVLYKNKMADTCYAYDYSSGKAALTEVTVRTVLFLPVWFDLSCIKNMSLVLLMDFEIKKLVETTRITRLSDNI
jgi:hypothetical protein